MTIDTLSLTQSRLSSSPLVKICVGSEEKPYSLPKDLIAHYSSYFASCFKNNWKEANEGVLRLSDEKPEFFDVLMEYFRHGKAKYARKVTFTTRSGRKFSRVLLIALIPMPIRKDFMSGKLFQILRRRRSTS